MDGTKQYTFSSGMFLLSALGPRRGARDVTESLDDSALDAVVLTSALRKDARQSRETRELHAGLYLVGFRHDC